MSKHLYKNVDSRNISFSDRLAIERTSLANERTLLSYVRTMIALIAVGGTFIKFFLEWYFVLLGFLLILFGFVVLIIGFTRYVRILFIINKIEEPDTKGDFEGDRLQYYLWAALSKLHI